MDSINLRIRRPRDKEELLKLLAKSGGGGPFDLFRDVIVFSAALGWWKGLRVSFEKSGEPIRWDVMIDRPGTQSLVNMLALHETGELGILSSDSFAERIRIFEEYANGGLNILEKLVSESIKRPADIIRDLVLEAGVSFHQDEYPIPDLSNVNLSF